MSQQGRIIPSTTIALNSAKALIEAGYKITSLDNQLPAYRNAAVSNTANQGVKTWLATVSDAVLAAAHTYAYRMAYVDMREQSITADQLANLLANALIQTAQNSDKAPALLADTQYWQAQQDQKTL